MTSTDQTVGWAHQGFWPADPASVHRVRTFVTAALERHNLSSLDGDLAVVVSELATNALRHASTEFTVTLEGGPDAVTVLVRDGSPNLPVLNAPDALSLTGRGLQMVEWLSKDWGVRCDASGKTVWASFRRPAS
jgi:anti-sigma regulatory factor (Ser/Thr protein kinase)